MRWIVRPMPRGCSREAISRRLTGNNPDNPSAEEWREPLAQPFCISTSGYDVVVASRQAAMTHACEPIETRLRRFPRGYQRRLRKLVKGSRALKELLYSFPGAAFVLAARSRSPEAQALGLKLVKAGRPLREVAHALDVPMWLRRLPPEAYTAPFGHLSGDDAFRALGRQPDPGAGGHWRPAGCSASPSPPRAATTALRSGSPPSASRRAIKATVCRFCRSRPSPGSRSGRGPSPIA
ncbi:MAG: hypothetical protein HC850_06820 [Rhodomicrobium sp.]|nr:hypothetical protein [Rhodomicrobium sp.]